MYSQLSLMCLLLMLLTFLFQFCRDMANIVTSSFTVSPDLQGHGQQRQQAASKVPYRLHSVSDDTLQHSRASLSHLQYKGYYSDSNVVAGFVQDKENEFESLRGFHNLLKAKTNPKPSGILNFGKTTSKATNGNVKCRKSTRSRK